jgi:hypothetical protein
MRRSSSERTAILLLAGSGFLARQKASQKSARSDGAVCLTWAISAGSISRRTCSTQFFHRIVQNLPRDRG